jgi:hypothetical protein
MNHVRYTKRYLKKYLHSYGLSVTGTRDELYTRWVSYYDLLRGGKVGGIIHVEKSDGSCFSDDDKRDEVYIGTRYNTFDSNKIIRFKPNGGNFDMYGEIGRAHV